MQPTKACLPRHRPFAYPVCVVARKPRFRSGTPSRHIRIGTSVCVVARKPRFRSGNPSATHTKRHLRLCRDKRGRSFVLDISTARRTGHCQKDGHQQNDYRKDNPRKDNHRMCLWASTRISWTRNRCCDQFDGHKMRSDNILHIPWPSLLRKLPPSFEPYLKNLWPCELHKGTNFLDNKQTCRTENRMLPV